MSCSYKATSWVLPGKDSPYDSGRPDDLDSACGTPSLSSQSVEAGDRWDVDEDWEGDVIMASTEDGDDEDGFLLKVCR